MTTYDCIFYVRLFFTSGVLFFLFLFFTNIADKQENKFAEMFFATSAMLAVVGMVVSVIGIIWTL